MVETMNQDDHTQQFDPKDIEDNKIMGVLAYLIFFLPLLAAKDSKWAYYHANQGLVLLLFAIGVNIVGIILDFIPILGWLLHFILVIFILVLVVVGMINASAGKAKPLPLIGGIKILK
ncbi:MAG: DUF4870 domain-containing protein [Bacteroidota bacterium]